MSGEKIAAHYTKRMGHGWGLVGFRREAAHGVGGTHREVCLRQVSSLVGTTSVNPVVQELTDSDACGASTRKSLEVETLSAAPLLPWASRDFADSLRPLNEIRDRHPDLVGAVFL